MAIVGILLAGGLSRRYGSPKAFAELHGKPFYQWVYEALAETTDRVVIVTRPELVGHFPANYEVMCDLPEVAGQGPLAGIYSVMAASAADRYIVLPCDMPYIRRSEVTRLVEAAGAGGIEGVTAVQTETHHLPLFSVWDSSMQEELKKEVKQGQWSVMKFLERVPTVWIESNRIHTDEGVFCNINKPDDQRKGGRQL